MGYSFSSAIEAENKAKMAMVCLKMDIVKEVSAVKDKDVAVSRVCIVVPWAKIMGTKSLKMADYDPKEQAAAVRSVLDQCQYASDMLHAVSKMAQSGLAVTGEGVCKLTPGTRAVLRRHLVHDGAIIR